MATFFAVWIKRERGEVLVKSSIEYEELELFKGHFTPRVPFRMEIDEGNKLFDVVGFQDTSNFAISEKLYLLLTKNEITGWKAFDICISGVSEKYFGFQVTGKCGRLERPTTKGFYVGYRFQCNSWDQLDFFSPADTALLFCTEKVKELATTNGISNIMFQDIREIEAYSPGE
jgi:hypothetical protein